MRSLPQVNYVPTASASLTLFRVAFVLIPIDVALYLYGESKVGFELGEPFEPDGIFLGFWQYRWFPVWVDGL